MGRWSSPLFLQTTFTATMASRLVRSAAGAAKLRPTLSIRTLPSLCTPLTSVRHASNVPAEDPKKKAQSIVDALPGNSLASKTAILSAGAGISIWAISNEFYGIFKYGGPGYTEWANSQVGKIKELLNEARTNHAASVKERIEDVKPLSNVVDITKQLFAVSKETAQLEAKAFELEQRTALAAEAKNVLDSWVRYEGQVKQRQQKELADSIIAKVTKELENPKVLQQILSQSVADVERIVASKSQ